MELRALEREEKRKRRQIELLEEQQRQEERLIQLRASKSKSKQAPSSREKAPKTDKKPEKAIKPDILTENVSSENNSNEAVLNQLQQLRSRLQQKHDAFKKK